MSDVTHAPSGSTRWFWRATKLAVCLAVPLAAWFGADALTELPGPPVVPVRGHLVVELEPTASPLPTSTPGSTAPPTSGPSTSPPPAVVPPAITRQPLPDDDDDDSGGGDDEDGDTGGDDDGGSGDD